MLLSKESVKTEKRSETEAEGNRERDSEEPRETDRESEEMVPERKALNSHCKAAT